MNSTIALNTKNPRFKTAPELYGLFFEDINHAADGGLYPERLRNRAFEDSLVPEDCTTDPEHLIYINEGNWPGVFNHGEGMDEWAAAVPPTEIPAWYADQAEMSLKLSDTLNEKRKAALLVHFRPGGSIKNIGYFGIHADTGEKTHFYAFLKTAEDCSLTLSLQGEKGQIFGSQALSVRASDQYLRYDADIVCSEERSDLSFVITADRDTEITFGFTSLMPEHTLKGHGLREDLALQLKNTHSRFIRFPGGCVVEGINEKNTLAFSKTVGPVWERPSAQLMWHYRTTNGLGFHEYLQLCEDLDMEALYVLNCGMSCQARHGKGFPEEVTKKYLQEALDALEYALGGTDTKWGALRAQMGHPEPFKLKYAEIGNENFGPEYLERYELFYKALKEAYPGVIFISNGHTERNGLPTEIVDEHYYNAPEFFLENTEMFDDYPREGPDIFLGEYAVNGGKTIASMECALAEAAFLTGVEKNQDIVKLSAYAPLMQNSDYTAWKPNLIVFNNHTVYGIPSYHAISLLAKYRGTHVIPLSLQGGEEPPAYAGIPGILCEEEGFLFKNVRVDGREAPGMKVIYGEVTYDEKEQAYRMIFGNRKHHYAGKNPVWNQAFEDFIYSGDFREVPIMWTMFKTPDHEGISFEFDAKFSATNSVSISVFNSCPASDAGCNEPKDTEWNRRVIRNQIWRIEDGKSALRVPRIFEKPVPDAEKVPTVIDYSKYNHYRIDADRFGYRCYINDALVIEKKQPLHPLLHASCETTDEMIYLKVVNIGSAPQELTVKPDTTVSDRIAVEYIEGLPDQQNSFECPLNISGKTAEFTAAISEDGSFSVTVPAYSVNVYQIRKA